MTSKQKAYFAVASVVRAYLSKHAAPIEPAVLEELKKVVEANELAASVQNDFPEGFDPEIKGSLAMGGIPRCNDCGKELKAST